MNICHEACEDNKRESLNSLLRAQTPLPERTQCEQIAVNTANCVCALNLSLGSKRPEASQNIDCIAQASVRINSLSYTEISQRTSTTNTGRVRTQTTTNNVEQKGINANAFLGVKTAGSPQSNDFNVKSTLTGYNCLSTGAGKIANSSLSAVCYPATTVLLTAAYLASPNKVPGEVPGKTPEQKE